MAEMGNKSSVRMILFRGRMERGKPSLKFVQDVLRGMRKDDSGVSEHSTSRSPSSYENFLVAGLFKKELTESKFPSTKKCRRSSFPVRPGILNPLALVLFAAGRRH